MSDKSHANPSPDSSALAAASPPKPVLHLPAHVAPGAENVNVLRIRTPTWIEIELIGMDDKPLPQEKYRVTLPDGSRIEGQLDSKGCARVEGFFGGKCLVTFPDLDKEAWENKDAG